MLITYLKVSTTFQKKLSFDLVDCLWGPWKSSSCSTSCGNGTKELTRTIIRNSTNGGKACDGFDKELVNCDYLECPGNQN